MDRERELARIVGDGLGLWNRHEFFACHDKLEEAWRLLKTEKKAEKAADPRRDLVHGIILYAAAYVHWSRGNPLGVRRKMEDARRVLAEAAPEAWGVRVDSLRKRVEADLERGIWGEAMEPARVPRLP